MHSLETIIAMNNGKHESPKPSPVKGFLRRKVLAKGQAPLGTYLYKKAGGKSREVTRQWATALLNMDAPMEYKPWQDTGVQVDILDGDYTLYWRDDA